MNKHKYRSLGTPPRLTFQARLLHNQEGANNAEKGGFRKISSRAFLDVLAGVHISKIILLSVVRNS